MTGDRATPSAWLAELYAAHHRLAEALTEYDAARATNPDDLELQFQ